MYRTTSANYGSRPPTVHTMPTHFYAKSQQFSKASVHEGVFKTHDGVAYTVDWLKNSVQYVYKLVTF